MRWIADETFHGRCTSPLFLEDAHRVPDGAVVRCRPCISPVTLNRNCGCTCYVIDFPGVTMASGACFSLADAMAGPIYLLNYWGQCNQNPSHSSGENICVWQSFCGSGSTALIAQLAVSGDPYPIGDRSSLTARLTINFYGSPETTYTLTATAIYDCTDFTWEGGSFSLTSTTYYGSTSSSSACVSATFPATVEVEGYPECVNISSGVCQTETTMTWTIVDVKVIDNPTFLPNAQISDGTVFYDRSSSYAANGTPITWQGPLYPAPIQFDEPFNLSHVDRGPTPPAFNANEWQHVLWSQLPRPPWDWSEASSSSAAYQNNVYVNFSQLCTSPGPGCAGTTLKIIRGYGSGWGAAQALTYIAGVRRVQNGGIYCMPYFIGNFPTGPRYWITYLRVEW